MPQFAQPSPERKAALTAFFDGQEDALAGVFGRPTEEELLDLGYDAAEAAVEAGRAEREKEKEQKEEKKSAATVLVEMAQERYDFDVSETGETFGVLKAGPQVVFMLRGGKTSLRAQLAREYFTLHRKAVGQQALADALLVVEGMAQEQEPKRLYLRTARFGGALYLDLGDATGRAVRIDGDGWKVVSDVPVLFKRTTLTMPLPVPVEGASLSELWEWLNIKAEDRPLVLGALVSQLYPDMPHPVPNLSGEQGTGKSTAAKVLSMILDPSAVPARKAPRDAESWITAASGSWVVALDNLSDMPPWLSDSICRAVTGDGDVRRALFTNGDLAVFSFRRCVILNGIDLGAVRGDLADRLIPLDLVVIEEDNRLEEDELWPAWAEAHPRILGALLDLAASVASLLPGVRLERKPRMADFARILKAVDEVMGTDGLTRYTTKQKALATDSLTGDVFITAVAETLTDFTGTAAELLGKVTPTDEKWRAPKGWPSSARAVTTKLRRQAPPMRKAGWVVEDDGGANHTNAVRWTITPPQRPGEAAKEASQDSRPSQEEIPASFASYASHQYAPSQVKKPKDPNSCIACGHLLDPAQVASGITMHRGCKDEYQL